jgi:hypothetical protein
MKWLIVLVLIVIIGITSVLVANHQETTQADKRRSTSTTLCMKHQGVERYNKYNLWCGDETVFWWDNGEWGQVGWRSYW